MALPGALPSPDPCKRVLRLRDPRKVQPCFLSWLPAGATAPQGEGVAIDGQRLRRACDQGRAQRASHRVRAGATEKGRGLGQRQGDATATELTASPEWLEVRALTGGMVTSDALGGQRASAPQSVERRPDSVLPSRVLRPPGNRRARTF